MRTVSSVRRFCLAFTILSAMSYVIAQTQTATDGVHVDLQNYFASTIQPLYTNATRFTFGVTGDIHLSRGSVYVLTKAEWQNLLVRWRDAGHLFGVLVGDLGYGAFQDIDDVTTGWNGVPNAPRIFYSMGNHETDDPAGKRSWIDALYPNAVRPASWTPTVARPGNSDRAYWAYNVGPYWRFVMLDADIMNADDGRDAYCSLGVAQLNWLAADLQANRNRNVMVFVHEPLDQPRYDTPMYTLFDRGPLMDILMAHPKQKFIFSGHLHAYKGITKWKGITSVHTSDAATGATGVAVSIDGETANVSWAGMTPSDTVDYDNHLMYTVTRVGSENVLRVGEEGGDYGQTRLQKMLVVGAEGGVTPTYGSLMLKGGPLWWYDSWFISEQLVKIVPGMKFSYDIRLQNVSGGNDAVAVQPNWVMTDGRLPPVVTDQNGIALSTRPRDGTSNLYYDDLPLLGGRATGRWYHREIDLTPLSGNFADGIHLVSRAMAVDVGTVYVDNIQFRWPAVACTGTLSPTSQTVAAGGASAAVSVAAAAGCTWTAVSNVPWVTITTGASGTGNGSVSYTVQSNSATATRSGTLTIAGQTFTVNQAAAVPDTTPPTIVNRTPAAGATNVSVATTVIVQFSKPMAASSINTSSIRLRANGAVTDVASTVTLSSATATLTPQQPLATATTYQVTVARTVADLSGNQMGTDATWSFTTSAQTPGLVLAFNFDEGTGTTAADVSGTGNPGTVSGATWTTAGRYGSALVFNGTSSWVTVNDAASLRLTSAMTLEAWVYPTALNSWNSVMLKEAPAGLRYALYGGNNIQQPAAYINFGGTDVGLTGPSAIALNAWTHLATTFDGATFRLFVNGTEVAAIASSGSLATSTGPLRIGGNAVWGEYFSGRIDDVRVYNRALTQADIQADMNRPVR